MLDLNRSVVDTAPQLNSQPGTSASLASLSSDSFSSSSFTDMLANIQAESLERQNEPETQNEPSLDAAMTQQFQSGTSLLNFSPGGQFGTGAENITYNTPASFQQPNPSVATSSPKSTQSGQDVYEGRQSPSASAATGSTDSPDESDQASHASAMTGKPQEKPRQHKDGATKDDAVNSHAGENSGGTDIGNGQGNPDSVSIAATPASAATTGTGQNETIPAPRIKNSKAGDSNGDLAFAVKFQGTDSAGSGNPEQTNSATNVGADISGLNAPIASSAFASQLAGMMARPATRIMNAGPISEGSTNSTASASGSSPGSYQASTNELDDVSETEDVAPPVALPDEQPVSAQSVKTVQVQITGTDDQRVDLKLMEKSGTLTMSVRSADGALAKTLQQNLPELSDKLNDQQIRAEWWRPESQPIQSSSRPVPSSDVGNSSSNQDQGNQNKENSGQQGGGRGTRQPDWLEELSSPRKSNQNGTQYSWQL